MALFDGKQKAGGNTQREKFASHKPAAKEGGKAEAEPKMKEEGEPTTTITHHADGTHTAEHSDGERQEKAHLGHVSMSMHAKHGDGEAMHAHKHEGGVTTHHVGAEGTVEGPHEHGSADEAGEHMKQMLGEDGGNGSMEMSDGMQSAHSMPSLY